MQLSDTERQVIAGLRRRGAAVVLVPADQMAGTNAAELEAALGAWVRQQQEALRAEAQRPALFIPHVFRALAEDAWDRYDFGRRVQVSDVQGWESIESSGRITSMSRIAWVESDDGQMDRVRMSVTASLSGDKPRLVVDAILEKSGESIGVLSSAALAVRNERVLSVQATPCVGMIEELHEEDRRVAGVYYFHVPAWAPDSVAAEAVLDRFHRSVPIKVVDDFDIEVVGENDQPVAPTDAPVVPEVARAVSPGLMAQVPYDWRAHGRSSAPRG